MLTASQADTLTEIINIGVKRVGSVLSELVGLTVGLKVPSVGISALPDLPSCLSLVDENELAAVHQKFSGSLTGKTILVFPRQSGSDLARHLIGDDPGITSIDAEREEALTEVGNILLNSILGSLSNALQQRFEYDIPVYREAALSELLLPEAGSAGETDESSTVLYANAHFDIQKFVVIGSMLIIFGAPSFEQLLSRIDRLTPAGATP